MKQSPPDYRCSNDVDLVEAALYGDEDAFRELLSRYRPLVRSIARSYFAMGSADEDLMQEALIGAVKAAIRSINRPPVAFARFSHFASAATLYRFSEFKRSGEMIP